MGEEEQLVPMLLREAIDYAAPPVDADVENVLVSDNFETKRPIQPVHAKDLLVARV